MLLYVPKRPATTTVAGWKSQQAFANLLFKTKGHSTHPDQDFCKLQIQRPSRTPSTAWCSGCACRFVSGQVSVPLVQPKWWAWMQRVELSRLGHFVSLFKRQMPCKDFSVLAVENWNSQYLWASTRVPLCSAHTRGQRQPPQKSREAAGWFVPGEQLWQSRRQTAAGGVLEGVPLQTGPGDRFNYF